jgi:alpha-N-arabinofuranosidase
LQDYDSFDSPDKIKPASFNDAKIDNDTVSLTMPPFSVIVLELK